MRISIDSTGLGAAKTGTAVYLTEILRVWNSNAALHHEVVIFATPNARSHLEPLALDSRFRFVPAPNNRLARILWQQLIMPVLIAVLRVDLHWGPGFVLPLLSRRPMVVTVHDLTFQLFPEVHERIKRFYFPAMIKGAVRKARTVIVISRSTGADLRRLIPGSQEKIVVIPLAARDFGQFASRLISVSQPASSPSVAGAMNSGNFLGCDVTGLEHADPDYVLFVGTLEPRKNLNRLLSAWLTLPEAVRGDTTLRVVGATGWMVHELDRRFQEAPSIEFLGRLNDSELFHILRGAKGFLYPSLYEGFGLPVIEAMSLEVPVLTSNVGATREVAEGAALLIDPKNVDDIGKGLIRLLSESGLRAELAVAGRARAREFSWEQTAAKTIDVIERSARRS